MYEILYLAELPILHGQKIIRVFLITNQHPFKEKNSKSKRIEFSPKGRVKLLHMTNPLIKFLRKYQLFNLGYETLPI